MLKLNIRLEGHLAAFTFLSLVTMNCRTDVELDWYCIQYKIVDCEVDAAIQLRRGFLWENMKNSLKGPLQLNAT